MRPEQLHSLIDPTEARLLVQQHVAVEVYQVVSPTPFKRLDAPQDRVTAVTVGLAHGTCKVLPVDSTPASWGVVNRNDVVDDAGLEQLCAARLQLLRCPDARLPSVAASKRRGIDHEEPARKWESTGSNEMRYGLEHEPGIRARDQYRQVTARATSAGLRFTHLR